MEEFEKNFINQFNKNKDKIKIPESVNERLKEVYKVIEEEKSIKIKKKNFIKRVFKGIIAILTTGLLSGIVYATVTGNSLLEFIEIGKSKEKFEDFAIEIGKTIEGDNSIIKLNKVACDSSYLMTELNIKITEKGLEKLNKNDGDFKLESNIIINNNLINQNNYEQYSKKISENEYNVYQIINMMEQGKNEFRVQINPLILYFEDSENYITPYSEEKTENMYSFEFDVNLINNTEKTNIEFNFEDVNLKIGDIITTGFASFANITTQITNLSSKENSDFIIEAFDKLGNKIETKLIYTNKMILTENNEELNLLYANNKKIVELINDTENLVTYEEQYKLLTGGDVIEYDKAEMNANAILLFENGINNNDKVILKIKCNKNKINKEVKINILKNSIAEIKNAKVINRYIDERTNQNYNIDGKVENKNYNEQLSKISQENFELNGIKIGMSKEEALIKLQNVYDKLGKKIKVYENLITEKYDDGEIRYKYDDGSFYLEFISDKEDLNTKLISMGTDTKNWENKGMKAEEFIAQYYSNIDWIEYSDELYSYKILYGIEFFKENKDVDVGYICKDASNRDSFIIYRTYNNNGTIFEVSITLNKVNKIIENIDCNISIQ